MASDLDPNGKICFNLSYALSPSNSYPQDRINEINNKAWWITYINLVHTHQILDDTDLGIMFILWLDAKTRRSLHIDAIYPAKIEKRWQALIVDSIEKIAEFNIKSKVIDNYFIIDPNGTLSDHLLQSGYTQMENMQNYTKDILVAPTKNAKK